MQKPDPSDFPHIELDLDAADPPLKNRSMRSMHIEQHPVHPIPKIEPVLSANDIGTDEASRTVGIFFLLTALPGLLSLLSGQGFISIMVLAIPIYFGIGLLRNDSFVRAWVKAACIAQIIMGPISLAIWHSSYILVFSGLAQNLGLLILVSARGLSKRNYYLCLGLIATGILVSTLVPFLH